MNDSRLLQFEEDSNDIIHGVGISEYEEDTRRFTRSKGILGKVRLKSC